MNEVLERWHHHEDDVRGLAGQRDRVVRRGSGVILTSPHAVPHVRDGVVKRADMWTGGLALLVADITGAGVAVETSGVGDPSWETHAFKDVLDALGPVAIVDLHAMRSVDGIVELGSGQPSGRPVPAAVDVARTSFDAQGITTIVDHRFPARGHHTLVQWARRRGIPAVQVEVSVRLTPPFVSDDDAESLVRALCQTVAALADVRHEVTSPGSDPAR